MYKRQESDPPSIQEIEEAIRALRNNKAPGTDLIPAELLKARGTDVAVALHSLIMDIWQTERNPMEWNKCIICPKMCIRDRHLPSYQRNKLFVVL